jgi:NAD(P)-dependent dehydrogenase (short-subunit alcohol dehydrogenase family)
MRDRGWGRVVNFASMAGKDGNSNLLIYSASKAAVIALTKSAGKELATSEVLLIVIAPAVIATPMNDSTNPRARLTSCAEEGASSGAPVRLSAMTHSGKAMVSHAVSARIAQAVEPAQRRSHGLDR